MYNIEFSEQSIKELIKMRKSAPQTYKKFESIIPELREHPYTGTGHPHQLRYADGIWSRKLDKKNRIRYLVNEDTVIVTVISAMGHYDDK